MTKYQKILNIMGWVCIAMAVLIVLAAVFTGYGLPDQSALVIDGTDYSSMPLVRYAGVIIVALLYLLLAWLCRRGAKNAAKVMPIFVLSLISLVIQVIDMANSGFSAAASIDNWLSLITAAFTFFVAYKVRKGE